MALDFLKSIVVNYLVTLLLRFCDHVKKLIDDAGLILRAMESESHVPIRFFIRVFATELQYCSMKRGPVSKIRGNSQKYCSVNKIPLTQRNPPPVHPLLFLRSARKPPIGSRRRPFSLILEVAWIRIHSIPSKSSIRGGR